MKKTQNISMKSRKTLTVKSAQCNFNEVPTLWFVLLLLLLFVCRRPKDP